MKNLAADPGFGEIKARLQREMDGWMRQQGDKGLETEMLAPTRQGKGEAEAGDGVGKKRKKKGKK